MSNWLQEHADSLGELADNETLKQYGSVSDVAKALVETKRMVGAMIRIPGEDASGDVMNEFTAKLEKIPGVARIPDSDDAEGMAALYRKLGAPESPDKYKIDINMPEGVKYDENRFEAIKKAAHGRGINNKQLQGLLEADAAYQLSVAQGLSDEQKAAQASLQNEWGVDCERRTANAVAIAKSKGGEALEDFLRRNPAVQADPAFLKTFDAFAKDYQEDGGKLPDTFISKGEPTPDEAQELLHEIRGNPAHPYNSQRMNDAKRAAMRKVVKLQALAAGRRATKEELELIDSL